MDNKNPEDIYEAYGITKPQSEDVREKAIKAMEDLKYCREHLEKINETRDALYKVINEIPPMHKCILELIEHVRDIDGVIIETGHHVMRINMILGLDEYDKANATKTDDKEPK